MKALLVEDSRAMRAFLGSMIRKLGIEVFEAEHGLDAATAAEKAALFAEAAAVLVADGTDPSTAAKAFFIPGRVEVMCKHTDYAGGRRCPPTPPHPALPFRI